MNRPRLFCEFPAGLAAVSLRIQGGAHCRPPISRCGNKAGYSQTILGVLGLHSGQGAGAYWWAEADPDVAALLRIYPDPDAMREVARIIRGWAGEEPRALWERLRAERRARGVATGTVGEVAVWMWVQGHGDSSQPPRLAAQYAHPEGNSAGQWKAPPRDWLADRADRLAEVAGWVVAGAWCYVQGDWRGPHRWAYVGPQRGSSSDGNSICKLHNNVESINIHTSHPGWPPVRVSPRIPSAAEVSAAIGTPGDLEGCIIYMDPPYAGTTGYTADLSREEVVMHALDFAALGATVAISEAEAIPDLVRSGWHSVEITGGRVGQKRTFSKQQREIITMNRPAEYVVPVQISIYRTPAHQELT